MAEMNPSLITLNGFSKSALSILKSADEDYFEIRRDALALSRCFDEDSHLYQKG